jgi:hypothetical protein
MREPLSPLAIAGAVVAAVVVILLVYMIAFRKPPETRLYQRGPEPRGQPIGGR